MMVAPLSVDLRLRLASALEEGETVRAAARRFGISVASAVPDLTMRELTQELAGRGVLVAHDTVWRFVRRAGQTVKKDLDGQRADAPEGRAMTGAPAEA